MILLALAAFSAMTIQPGDSLRGEINRRIVDHTADINLTYSSIARYYLLREGLPPDMVIKTPDYTLPAVHQDEWWRPVSDIPVTEPRWVKMVEIRPSNLAARKIIHHSIAYLVLNNDQIGRAHV